MSDEPAECPLCMEALEIDDHSFFPCTCGYQICRFCWHRIRTDENGLCPACRKQYPEDPAEFKPLTDDELQNIKKERKQKDVQRKQKAAENRKHLANVRVVQRNLVFVVGLSPRLADPEVLKKHEYFGKFGKIHKVVINQSTSYAGSQGPSASAYVTYVKPEDALRAILTVNNVHVEGRTLKTSLGTTKYCSHFLKGTHCQKNDCMYLHELGEEAASFTKDEMQAGKHQDYEQMLTEQFLNAQNSANNHVLGHSKLKKSASPQSIENPDVIPSLMDMTGDIKHSLPMSNSLLPNPAQPGGGGPSNGHHSQTSGWPLLDSSNGSPAPGSGGSKADQASNSTKAQGQNNSRGQRSSPENGGNGSKAVGAGRQRGSNSVNSLSSAEENHIASGSLGSSTSASPNGVEEELSSSPCQSNGAVPHLSLQGMPHHQTLAGSPRELSQQSAGSSPPSNTNSAMHLQVSMSQQASGPSEEVTTNGIGAIGSNRRPLLSDPSGAQGLSFFGNNLLNPSPVTRTAAPQPPSPNASQGEERDFYTMPNVSLPNQEMAETLPVSSSTDWSAAFGFNSKDLPPDDDLGFDPCAESFKGLADLIEKENSGMQQQFLPPNPGQSAQLQHTRLGSPSQSTCFAPHPVPPSPHQQNNTQPSLRSLPPGFSLSHIQQQHLQQQQQQQQQHFFRPELSGSKMLELLPQFPPVSSQQRFNPLHSYNSMPLDLHSQTQQPHRDMYNMKDMQDQLRSMLPNINISFGSVPHQTQPPQQQINSLHHTQQSQHLNKSWPLSSSPDSPWNDPAILTTSQFSDATESAPHWLKSLQQLTESEAPPSSHRLPFVQQFPLATGGAANGWPPHTHNPPPGFRAPGLAGQGAVESHQMAEVLQ